MFDFLIVDLDGTLVDSRIDITNALNETMRSYNLPEVDEETVKKHVGTGILPIIEARVKKSLLPDFLSSFDQNYLKSIAANTRLFPTWDEVLIKTQNIPKVILSNKSQKFCDPLVSSLGLDRYFLNTYGREAFSERKPSGVPVQEILRIHEKTSSTTLVIGDTETDIRSGKSSQVKTCGITFGYGSKEELIRLNPDYLIDSPLDLLKILRS